MSMILMLDYSSYRTAKLYYPDTIIGMAKLFSLKLYATLAYNFRNNLMLSIENLTKRFDDIIAVDEISFEVAKGETFGFLGPNGAGKTTTLNILCGLLIPDGGEVRIDSKYNPSLPDVRRKFGCAPQALALYDELTGRENLSFFGNLYGLTGSELKRRTDWALEFADLTSRGSYRVSTYSGGMKRRLNLACALVHEPPVLLLDEPTVGVDPQSRNMIFDKIEELKQAGRTVLYTTHYIEEAERLCDRVAIIDHGKILAIDTVANLIAGYGGNSIVLVELTEQPADPSELPGIIEENCLRIETDRPQEIVAELAGKGIKFSSLKIEHADLETVFLNLTGRRLRD